MPVQREESVRETFMVQESSSMNWDAIIMLIGLGVAQLMSKLGKTQGQSVAIWMVIMGAFLVAIW